MVGVVLLLAAVVVGTLLGSTDRDSFFAKEKFANMFKESDFASTGDGGNDDDDDES
jgi:hypothetical protein